MKFEIELTKEQLAAFNKAKQTRKDTDDRELLARVIDRGLYDINYRTARNKQQWAEFKAFKQSQKQ